MCDSDSGEQSSSQTLSIFLQVGSARFFFFFLKEQFHCCFYTIEKVEHVNSLYLENKNSKGNADQTGKLSLPLPTAPINIFITVL